MWAGVYSAVLLPGLQLLWSSRANLFRAALFQEDKSCGSLPLAVLPEAQGMRKMITPPSLLTKGKLHFYSAKGQRGFQENSSFFPTV